MNENFGNAELERGDSLMVNERISAAIADSGLKQKHVADKIGVSESVFSAILAGRRKVDVDEFFSLCQVLNKTPEELYNYQRAQGA